MLDLIEELLEKAARLNTPSLFFKTAPGHYAAHDKFLGIPVPKLREIAKKHAALPLLDIQRLLTSPYNEKRLLALFILIHQYKKKPETTHQFYLENLQHVNNWNLVDSSAHLILGAYLETRDKTRLITLANSENLWEKRVAIIATFYYIKKNNLDWTFKIAQILLHDTHDLIHKAVGWMLREAGKQNQDALTYFLNKHHIHMPRTMLRYAIEKYSPEIRAKYLLRK